MANISALAEPSTLEAEFSAQAHFTEGACCASKRERPVGIGMPIKKAGGAIISTVTMTFSHPGQPTPASASGPAACATSVTSKVISDMRIAKR